MVGAAVSIALDPPGQCRRRSPSCSSSALALLAELKPVPLEEDDLSTVSLAFVFILACVILFGWQEAVLVGDRQRVSSAQVVERKPLERTAFNTAVYALSAFAAALPLFLLGPADASDPVAITVDALLGGAAFVAVNFAFISLAISFHQRMPVLPLLKEEVRLVGPAFAIQAFLAALAAALWVTDPRLLVLMAGPLFTVTLYQRSSLASRRATRDAHTDSLTLHREQPRLRARSRDRARCGGRERTQLVSLCLVDVDDFKQINDTYGHPLGDQVLVEVARLLRDGDGLPRHVPLRRRRVRDRPRLRRAPGALRTSRPSTVALSVAEFSHGASATVSVGVATFPDQARDVGGLERAADAALYWAKQNGKNRSCVYSPAVAEASGAGGARAPHRAPRAAASRGEPHPRRRREGRVHGRALGARRAARGGDRASVSSCDDEQVEQLKLAGRLHDLGKIAIPDRVLQKPGALTPHEERQLAHHPELGASLLDGMDIRPVDVWIRHHHEHWDGSGYPHGLAGEEIPFGSRVILVADAYDAITTERSYRDAASPEDGARRAARVMPARSSTRRSSLRSSAHLESAGLVDSAVARRQSSRCASPESHGPRVPASCSRSALGLVLGGRLGGSPRSGSARRGSSSPRSACSSSRSRSRSSLADARDGWRPLLWVASYGAAGRRRGRSTGASPVCRSSRSGCCLNLVAILANRGTMPVSYEAMHGAGRSAVTRRTRPRCRTRACRGSSIAGRRRTGSRSRTCSRSATSSSPSARSCIVLAAMGVRRPTLARLTRRPNRRSAL